MLNKTIRFFLENKLIAVLLLLTMVAWGTAVAPFSWDINLLPRDPVVIDAIPNLGQNQQIVYTRWPGRSPQDVEDQITYKTDEDGHHMRFKMDSEGNFVRDVFADYYAVRNPCALCRLERVGTGAETSYE